MWLTNHFGLSLADGKLNISGETIVTIVVCVVIMIALITFVQKTKPGQAMRAVSEDRGAAQLMGINVNATIALTFAIGSGLAAVAGVLLCSTYPSLTPYTGAIVFAVLIVVLLVKPTGLLGKKIQEKV